jgi:predicted DNA repair protein MutK
MPAGSLLALLDDITSTLDDVAAMTKVATKKTAGVLGDDLALNAEQVAGVSADRELPVVWAVAKGSAKNKLILAPAALLLSAVAPWAVTPLLMFGGTFLCFEGVEKLAHKFLHRGEAQAPIAEVDPQQAEKAKIRGAIRTDFVLSAEIIVIALGTVATAPLPKRVLVVCVLAALMTVGVYGLVAGIVKLDDLGLSLLRRSSSVARKVGAAIIRAVPYLMKALAIAGTLAMFLVGGGILTHGFPRLERVIAGWAAAAGPAKALVPALVDLGVGVVVGTVALTLWTGASRVLRRSKS